MFVILNVNRMWLRHDPATLIIKHYADLPTYFMYKNISSSFGCVMEAPWLYVNMTSFCY